MGITCWTTGRLTTILGGRPMKGDPHNDWLALIGITLVFIIIMLVVSGCISIKVMNDSEVDEDVDAHGVMLGPPT
jgi:hypothetical protein